MFIDIPPFYCIIYRLTTFTDNDFSASNEGEVTEDWGIVSFGTPCRYDTGTTPTRRRLDGVVDTGSRPIYFEAGVDVRAFDRISVNNMFYQLSEVDPIYGYDNTIHHYEGRIDVIDWDLPDYLTQWTDDTIPASSEIIEVSFDITTESPKYLASLGIGDTVGKVGVLIEQEFENAATISVGTSLDHEELMATTDNIPTIINYYEVVSNYEATVEDSVYLYLDIDESTTGEARVFLEIVREP